MGSFENILSWLDDHRDLGLDIIRIYLGVGLFVKGVYFIGHTNVLVEMMGEQGIFSVGQIAIAHYVAVAHLVGGLFMTVGLLTRIAAAVQIPVLIGAVFLVHLREGLFTRGQNLEFTAFVLFSLIIFALFGSGRLSLDHQVFRKGAGQD